MAADGSDPRLHHRRRAGTCSRSRRSSTSSRSRGHEVAVRTLASQVDADALARLRRGTDRPGDRGASSPTTISAVRRWRRRSARWRLRARAPASTSSDLREAIADVTPDVLLVDFAAGARCAAAEAWGGPWASWFPYPLPLPSRDAPPFGPGFRPRAACPAVCGTALLRPLAFGARRADACRRASTRFARASAYRPLSGAADMFAALPLLMYMTAEPFEYPRSDWPQHVRLVGPCDWDPAGRSPVVAGGGRCSRSCW